MRAKHTPHNFPAFPVYVSAFLSANQLVVGGGGGTSKSGIKNQIRLYNVDDQTHALELIDQVDLAPGEDAPMSMATSSSEPHPTIVCGVNAPEQEVRSGHNENCRVFGLIENKFGILSTRSTLPIGDDNLEDYQKVTVVSPDSSMVAVAGTNTFSLHSYPTLLPLAATVPQKEEIWDISFSSDSLLVATESKLLIYALPGSSDKQNESGTSSSKKKKKNKRKSTSSSARAQAVFGNDNVSPLPQLILSQTIELPGTVAGETGSVFRAAKYHPTDDNILYTITNTIPPRDRSRKKPSRRGYACKWVRVDDKWNVDKVRKISDKGVTAFDISPNGKFLAFGGSDYKIGLLDTQTLAPVIQILHAHTLPPTTIAFNSTSTLLTSGSADNSIRIISVPEHKGGASWGIILLIILTLLVLLAAFVLQK